VSCYNLGPCSLLGPELLRGCKFKPEANIMATAKLAIIALLSTSTLAFPVRSFGQFSQVTQALSSLQQVIGKIDLQVQNSSAETKAKLGDLAQPTPVPKPQVELATESDRAALCGRVTAFADHADSDAHFYSQLAFAAIAVSTVLALFGSIASFLSKNKAAGIISLVVASIVGMSNAYPLAQVADFNRHLAGEARALRVDCELTKPFTVNAYASDVNQFRLLYVYEEKKPSFGSPRIATDELAKELQEVRTASSNVIVAQK